MKRTYEIGQTVYYFDVNHREYTKAPKGKIWGTLIYEKHFVPHKIVGENEKEYELKNGGTINKRSGLMAFWKSRHRVYTEEEKQDYLWARDHKFRIVKKLEMSSDVELLKKIAALIGYKTEVE